MHSPGNLFGLTKKFYVPGVARRFNRKNFFRNSCFYVLMTRYFILISISNCSLDILSIWGDRNTIYKTRDLGDQKIESLCVSWWSLLYNFFLAYSSSCSIDQKHPTTPRNRPNHHASRLSTRVLILAFPPLFSIGSYNQEEYSLHKKSPGLKKPEMDLYCLGFSLSETSQCWSSSWLVLPSISRLYHTRRSACS